MLHIFGRLRGFSEDPYIIPKIIFVMYLFKDIKKGIKKEVDYSAIIRFEPRNLRRVETFLSVGQ